MHEDLEGMIFHEDHDSHYTHRTSGQINQFHRRPNCGIVDCGSWMFTVIIPTENAEDQSASNIPALVKPVS